MSERTLAEAYLAGAKAGWDSCVHDAATAYAARFDLKESHEIGPGDLEELRDIAGVLGSLADLPDSEAWLRGFADRLDQALATIEEGSGS